MKHHRLYRSQSSCSDSAEQKCKASWEGVWWGTTRRTGRSPGPLPLGSSCQAARSAPPITFHWGVSAYECSQCSIGRRSRRQPSRRAQGHLRVVARHRVRVVRLLSLRHPGAVLRGTVLSAGQRDGGPAVGLRRLCRGLPGPPVRRAGVRTTGRPGRPQVHLPGHHPVHGRLDLRRRPAADLLGGRLARSGADGLAASRAGPGAGRRVWRGGDLRGRTCAARPSRLCHELDPDHGDPGLLPVARGHRDLPRPDGRQGVRRLGLARAVPGLAHPADLLGLYPAQAERVADLHPDEGGG